MPSVFWARYVLAGGGALEAVHFVTEVMKAAYACVSRLCDFTTCALLPKF